jgi:hypothetical protein
MLKDSSCVEDAEEVYERIQLKEAEAYVFFKNKIKKSSSDTGFK